MGRAEWFLNNLKKTCRYLKRNGPMAAGYAAIERILQEREQKGYVYMPPDEEELKRQRSEAEGIADPPLFSVVVPAYEPPVDFLNALLDSMQVQSWPHWELILADAGEGQRVKKAVLSRGDSRIRYIKLAHNAGIAGNTNEAISHAGGRYIGLLDHDDFLSPDALYEMAAAVRASEEKGIFPIFLYSDEDKCDGAGKRFYEPHWKPDFDPDLLLSNNYICHFLVMRSDKLKELKLRSGFDGAQDYDLVLRAGREAFDGGTEKYVHVPKILYHWRCHGTSTSQNPESKGYAYEAGKRALEDFCATQGWQAQVVHTQHLGFYRVHFTQNLLETRRDVGAVAGPLPPCRGRMCSGIYDQTGEGISMRYAGLRKGFGGYMHRARLPQDVKAADIRRMRVRTEWKAEWEASLLRVEKGADPAEESIAFGRKLEMAGLRILWLPEWKEEAD